MAAPKDRHSVCQIIWGESKGDLPCLLHPAVSCSGFWKWYQKNWNTTPKKNGISVLKVQFCREAFFFLLKRNEEENHDRKNDLKERQHLLARKFERK